MQAATLLSTNAIHSHNQMAKINLPDYLFRQEKAIFLNRKIPTNHSNSLGPTGQQIAQHVAMSIYYFVSGQQAKDLLQV